MMISRTEVEQDEQLVNLFRNRAQLKKAYLELQDQCAGLKDQLRNSQASTRRAEERLEAIERLMARPEAGFSGLVYFQLRSLWRACNEQLKKFSEELQRQQDDRERKRQILRFNEDRGRRLADLADLLSRVKAESDVCSERVREIESELAQRRGFWNYFRRKELRSQQLEVASDQAAVRQRLDELIERRIKIESEPWPEFTGLSIEGRRAINIAAIAYAHQLFTQLSVIDIARLCKDAVVRPIQDHKYGSEEDCSRLIGKIQKLSEQVSAGQVDAEKLRRVARDIRKHAEFRNPDETVPVASSLDDMMFHDSDGRPVPAQVNVMAEEYWDLYDVFLA
ncbi:MAG: hypothetical protein WBN65_12115 [Gammaproteobacteria bacterium]